MAKQQLDIFSDLVLDRVLSVAEYLENISQQQINLV